MKQCVILILLMSVWAISCKDHVEKNKETTAPQVEQVTKKEEKVVFPEDLQKVFEAHGGLDLWKKQRTLVFELPKPNNPEVHTTDLWSRKDRIDTPKYSLGFDGEKVWVLDPDGNYEGKAEFYHNLMFYFYAMPFVLADKGIVYEETEPLDFEGKAYPGIRISYNDDIGFSSKDEYYLHYHPETFQMEWLGYTVTFGTEERSDHVRWIRYNDWNVFNGLVLPNAISWYDYEGRIIKDLKNTASFVRVKVLEIPMPAEFYKKPVEIMVE